MKGAPSTNGCAYRLSRIQYGYILAILKHATLNLTSGFSRCKEPNPVLAEIASPDLLHVPDNQWRWSVYLAWVFIASPTLLKLSFLPGSPVSRGGHDRLRSCWLHRMTGPRRVWSNLWKYHAPVQDYDLRRSQFGSDAGGFSTL